MLDILVNMPPIRHYLVGRWKNPPSPFPSSPAFRPEEPRLPLRDPAAVPEEPLRRKQGHAAVAPAASNDLAKRSTFRKIQRILQIVTLLKFHQYDYHSFYDRLVSQFLSLERCRSSLANISADTAEKESSKIWQTLATFREARSRSGTRAGP